MQQKVLGDIIMPPNKLDNQSGEPIPPSQKREEGGLAGFEFVYDKKQSPDENERRRAAEMLAHMKKRYTATQEPKEKDLRTDSLTPLDVKSTAVGGLRPFERNSQEVVSASANVASTFLPQDVEALENSAKHEVSTLEDAFTPIEGLLGINFQDEFSKIVGSQYDAIREIANGRISGMIAEARRRGLGKK